MKRSVLVMFATLLVAPAMATAAPTVVSVCGGSFLQGVLASDLDCSATPGYAVTLQSGGSLDLAGHTLVSGSADVIGGGGGVLCLGDCSVNGGGGSLVSGEPIDLNDNSYPTGVRAPFPPRSHVSITGTTISGYDNAASAFTLDIEGSTLSANMSGLSARELRIASTTITNPDPWGHQSASGRRMVISDSVLTGGGGVGARLVEIYRTTITGMHDGGVQAQGTRRMKRLYAEDSVIDGNCANTSGEYCGDLLSTLRLPELVNTTCSTSVRYLRNGGETGHWGTWGICSQD